MHGLPVGHAEAGLRKVRIAEARSMLSLARGKCDDVEGVGLGERKPVIGVPSPGPQMIALETTRLHRGLGRVARSRHGPPSLCQQTGSHGCHDGWRDHRTSRVMEPFWGNIITVEHATLPPAPCW